MTLEEFGVSEMPSLRRPILVDGEERCPACNQPVQGFLTDLLDVHREHVAHDTTRELLERAGIDRLKTRGKYCPSDGTQFPNTVATPWAIDWQGYVGVRCEFDSGDGIHAVPVRLEDFGPLRPLLEEIQTQTVPTEEATA